MGHNGDGRRQRRGSAWHWRQTDCWYYTQPGTKKRVPLVDEDGKRIRGKANRKAAEVALARVKLAGQWRPMPEPAKRGEWLVARVCSEYLGYCERNAAAGTISSGHCDEARRYLNALSAQRKLSGIRLAQPVVETGPGDPQPTCRLRRGQEFLGHGS